MFNTSLDTFYCHNLVLFLYFPCNKILLNFCFACIMFLFLFFLFHDLNLEWSLLLLLSWFRNPRDMVIFVPITIRTNSNQTYFHHFFLLSFCFKIMSTFMEEVLATLRNLEHENQAFCECVAHLQTNQVSTSLGCAFTTQPQPKVSHISLFDKFNGACSKFWSFFN